jgi:hypothetical protein
LDRQGKPVVGTGNKGNIYRIEDERVSTQLVDAAPTQVTALVAGPKGQVYAATGNVGKIFSIGPELEKQGSYESQALDAGSFSYWGRINYKAELNGGELRLESRSGNLDRPQKSWSGWTLLDQKTQRVPSPSARFLQYRVTLISGHKGSTPVVREMEVAYMPKNAAPELREVEIAPANYRFNPPSPLLTPSTQSITLPPMGQRNAAARSSPTVDTANTSQTLLYAKGQVGARWLVSDPNGDDMRYKVEIRGLEEAEWKLLKDEVKERFITWDSTTFADGEYVLQVSASDAPSNPPDRALQSSLVSERFAIDNTPPEIANVVGERKGKQVSVRWSARDARSLISKAEYSLNGGDWRSVEPVGRLSDASQLSYVLEFEAPDGEQTVAVRVTDEFDNTAVGQTVVRR